MRLSLVMTGAVLLSNTALAGFPDGEVYHFGTCEDKDIPDPPWSRP